MKRRSQAESSEKHQKIIRSFSSFKLLDAFRSSTLRLNLKTFRSRSPSEVSTSEAIGTKGMYIFQELKDKII
jgi:hypothetical protein